MHLKGVVPVLMTVALLVAGCASGQPSSGGQSTQPSDVVAAGEPDGDDAANEGAGSDPGAAAAGVEPIKVGEMTSYSGFNIFPEPVTAARLEFQRYNDGGGLDGRPIELVSVDDQDTVEGAASGARRLFESEGVVGFCCGGSIVDCTANASYYAENGVEVVPGIAACAEAPTVHPVNVGPFLPILHMLDFFVYDLGRAELCITAFDTGLTPIFLENFLPVWEAASRIKVNVVVADPGQDLAPIATKLRDDGCEAVMLAFTEFGYQSFFEVAATQEILGEMDFGMLTSGYSLTLLDVSGQHMEGVYAASSFEPFTGPPSALSVEVQDYLGLMAEVGELPTGLGQGGYLAANIMIAALESIEGEITFESVQEAIGNVTYETTMLGQPFTATGYVDGIQPNLTTRIVQVQDREFVTIGDEWHTFPRSSP